MGLFDIFKKNRNKNSNAKSYSSLHSLILANLKDDEENRNWNEVPDLYIATKNYNDTPAEGRRILPIATGYCEKYPDFDLPWLWVTSCKFMMNDKEGAFTIYKTAINKCIRKGGLYGTFASNYYEWAVANNVSITDNDAYTFIASCVGAHKLDSGMFFSRLFLADFIKIHNLLSAIIENELRSQTRGNSFYGDYHNTLLKVVRSISVDNEVKRILDFLH
jgi:hypothetical protein